MGSFQEFLYVRKPRLSPPPYEVHRLPSCHDPLRVLRVCRHSCVVRLREGTRLDSKAAQLCEGTQRFLHWNGQLQHLVSVFSTVRSPPLTRPSNGIYVATIFGAGFFFDLFFPERYEPANIRWAWKICAVVACITCLADALGMTVIVARYSASITANTADQLAIAQSTVNPPLKYSHNGRAIASVVLLWPGWVATVYS